MSETHKIDHEMTEHNGLNLSHSNGAALSRQVTVALTPEQYERLFFQPSAPQKGDLAKRFANPSLLGLLGFLVPLTSTVLILCGFQGAVAPTSLVGLTGDYYFVGCITMLLAGIAEFILGNTFPMAVFLIYGSHWGSLAYTQDPIYNITAPFAELGGATGAAYNSSQGFHYVSMAIASFIFLIGTLRVNLLFVFLFFGLVMLFSFIAAAAFSIGSATTAADLAHIEKLFKIAGGFGFIVLVAGWYLALLTVCEAVEIPCPLPVLDLSSKVFPKKEAKATTEAS